jgi:hypothetical protein
LENSSDEGTTHECEDYSPNSDLSLCDGNYSRYKRSHSNLGRILTITPSFNSLSVLDTNNNSDNGHLSNQGDVEDDDYADYIDLDTDSKDFDNEKSEFDKRRDITHKSQSEIIKGERERGSPIRYVYVCTFVYMYIYIFIYICIYLCIYVMYIMYICISVGLGMIRIQIISMQMSYQREGSVRIQVKIKN